MCGFFDEEVRVGRVLKHKYKLQMMSIFENLLFVTLKTWLCQIKCYYININTLYRYSFSSYLLYCAIPRNLLVLLWLLVVFVTWS